MTRPETTKKLSELTEKLINPNNDSRIYWATNRDKLKNNMQGR